MGEPRVAVVTGGGRGLGRAICVALAAGGYWVVVNYKSNQEAAEQTLELIRSSGPGGELLPFDVTDAQAANAHLKDLIGRYSKVEVLVNNAGIAADSVFGLMSADEWRRVLDTTLDGFFNCTKPLLTHMVSNRRGSIVSMSSISALVGNRGQANYAAAKAGLIGATRAVASEVARLGVRVNCVAPGVIETEMVGKLPLSEIKKMIPMGRLGRPEEVAGVVRFLCSDEASYITGQVISVNGGML
jgi:3-oxoacyl-[acyl-carrier protein] reductase